jgi:exopolyphosphatase
MVIVPPRSSLHTFVVTILTLRTAFTSTSAFSFRSIGFLRVGSCKLIAACPKLQQCCSRFHARLCVHLFQPKVELKGPVTIAFMSSTVPNGKPSVPTLQEFLRRRKLRPTTHIVIGNEAGDADSIISAICYAYIQECVSPTVRSAPMTPVVSISGKDLQTQRPETVRLLQLAGISLQDLCHIDDAMVLKPDADTKLLNITLVDHNRLSANRPYLNDGTNRPFSKVVGILDHHLDEGYHTDTCIDRNIAYGNNTALVASTCTLIVEAMEREPKVVTPYPAPLSLLLMGVVLLDSVNMDPRSGKVTERDVAAIETLLFRTDWQDLEPEARILLEINMNAANPVPNTTALFQVLQNAKFSPTFWSRLSVHDALRLDYKQFTPSPQSSEVKTLGVSTVLMPLSEFWAKDAIRPCIFAYMKDVQIELFGIMFVYSSDSWDVSGGTNGGLKRELTLVGSNPLMLERLIEFLLKEGSLQLQGFSVTTPDMSLRNHSTPLTIRSFQQLNTAASRKQLVPLVLKFFEETMA